MMAAPSTPETSLGAAATPRHVVVIDDDPQIRQMVADYLGDRDVRVTALAGSRGLEDLLSREAIELLLLDLKLPGEDGIEIARRVRQTCELPIIVLTGRLDEADRVMALELGADDYLTKPFSLRELLARMRAVLRRSRGRESIPELLSKVRLYRFAGWELNVRLRQLRAPDDALIGLTNNDFNLLVAFLAAPQQVLPRDRLIDLSRLHNDEVYDRTIDVQVGRLRRKLEAHGGGELIATERGAGYVFRSSVEVLR